MDSSMESSIDNGDPWEIPDQEPEPEPAQIAGGMNPIAEGTGLFARVRAAQRNDSPDDPETAEESSPDDLEMSLQSTPETLDQSDDVPIEVTAPVEPATDEGLVTYEPLTAYEPTVAQEVAQEPVAAYEPLAAEEPAAAYEPTVPHAPTYVPPSTADAAVESVESVLHELEMEPPPVFDLIPPSVPEEETPMFETYDPESLDEGVETAADVPSDNPVAPAYEPPANVYTPPAEVEASSWEDPAEIDDYGVVEIEFGAPQTPEGAELPTGKATLTAGEGVITRPVLLTTATVEGAKVAPVDMVVAVQSVDDASAVPAAVDRVLEALRDRCAEVGGEAVVAVATTISSVGSSIMITASGTAVNLL